MIEFIIIMNLLFNIHGMISYAGKQHKSIAVATQDPLCVTQLESTSSLFSDTEKENQTGPVSMQDSISVMQSESISSLSSDEFQLMVLRDKFLSYPKNVQSALLTELSELEILVEQMKKNSKASPVKKYSVDSRLGYQPTEIGLRILKLLEQSKNDKTEENDETIQVESDQIELGFQSILYSIKYLLPDDSDLDLITHVADFYEESGEAMQYKNKTVQQIIAQRRFSASAAAAAASGSAEAKPSHDIDTKQ